MITCHHCNAELDPIVPDCDECGRPVGSRPLDRAGDRFTVWRGVDLPPFCVRCGAPARDVRWKRTYYWHEPFLYLLILAGFVVYVIVALVLRKRFELEVPMCEAHWLRRGKLQKVAVALLVPMVGFIVLAFAGNFDKVGAIACPGAILTLLASLIVYMASERSLTPRRITDDSAEFSGASPEFLAVLE